MSRCVYSAKIMDAQATDETTSTVIGPAIAAKCGEVAFHVAFGTGVTAGVVEIEASDDPADTGTWASLATVTFSGTAPNQQIVQVTGTALCYRARISTAIANGTVDVTFVGWS